MYINKSKLVEYKNITELNSQTIVPQKPALEKTPLSSLPNKIQPLSGFYIYLTMFTQKLFENFYPNNSNCTAIKQSGLQFLNDLKVGVSYRFFQFADAAIINSKEGTQMALDKMSLHCRFRLNFFFGTCVHLCQDFDC